jgi:hypothetical protein
VRIPPSPILTRAFVSLAGALALAGAVVAQTAVFRTLPEDAKRGYLSHVGENLVDLDGRRLRLAPGAQIRSASNLIVLPAALPRNSLVKYQLNGRGELARAWVLTAEEAAKPDKSSASGGPDAGRPFSEIVPQHSSPSPAQQTKP